MRSATNFLMGRTLPLVLLAFTLLAGLFFCTANLHADETENTFIPQITLPCEVVEIVDGDTVTVRFEIDARVRLLDCWAAEKKQTSTPGEKERGLAARDFLKEFALNKHATIQLPLQGTDRLDKAFTFGRLKGTIRIRDSEVTIGQTMIAAGYAYPTKAELRASLE